CGLLAQIRSTCASLKDQKALFRPAAIGKYGTLSPGTSIPALDNFTLCIYVRPTEIIENGMTVFTYNTDRKLYSRFSRNHELGIMIKDSSLIIWLFGTEIELDYVLSLHNWHYLCLTWHSAHHKANIYVNKTQIHTKFLVQDYKLFPNGSLLLGQSHKRRPDRLQVDLDMAFVGELYMFNLWNYIKRHQILNLGCEDGNIISWNSQQWDFMGLDLEYDYLLPCCKYCRLTAHQISLNPIDCTPNITQSH
uniref:Pentraxin family member n=1 Tax=Callorhinchus milii TaxID=7868 RepID=A0A4W3ITH1_CALMI